MNYFEHHSNKPSGRVWSLFSELSEANVKELNSNYSVSFGHTVEIVNAALSGNIDFDNFNLTAYEYKCNENDNNEKYNNAKQELFIVDEYGSTEETQKVGFGDISMRRLGHKDQNLEQVVDMQAFDECLANLLGIRKRVIIEHGVDIVRALERSLTGIPDAINLVKVVVSKDEEVEEVVTSLCSTAPREGLCSRLKAVA